MTKPIKELKTPSSGGIRKEIEEMGETEKVLELVEMQEKEFRRSTPRRKRDGLQMKLHGKFYLMDPKGCPPSRVCYVCHKTMRRDQKHYYRIVDGFKGHQKCIREHLAKIGRLDLLAD